MDLLKRSLRKSVPKLIRFIQNSSWKWKFWVKEGIDWTPSPTPATSEPAPAENIILLTTQNAVPGVNTKKWVFTSKNIPSHMCAKWGFRSDCAFRAVWSKSSLGAFWIAKDEKVLTRKTKTLIRLLGCASWFESSLGAYVKGYAFTLLLGHVDDK